VFDDTEIGGRDGRFPLTRHSLMQAVQSADTDERRRALDVLIAAYWKPVYKYIRLRWSKDNEQAKDLTQEFFVRLLEKDFLESYDPSRARLRTYLRICLDRFLSNALTAEQRIKRGGEIVFLPLDFETAEGELRQLEPRSSEDVEEFFAREWTRSVFSNALERLRQECESKGKLVHFQLLELYDVEEGGKRLTYSQVGKQFGIKSSDVTNYLAYARREFRRIVLDSLREMTASEEEFRREARALLGIEVR
jgi:RNA polymerase sigma factor (sigma-70 family)